MTAMRPVVLGLLLPSMTNALRIYAAPRRLEPFHIAKTAGQSVLVDLQHHADVKWGGGMVLLGSDRERSGAGEDDNVSAGP